MAGSKSVWSLIVIPALITLAVTLLRLVGDLEHWPSPWFSNAAGGGAASVVLSIVGIHKQCGGGRSLGGLPRVAAPVLIGRAACRGKVEISGGAGSFKK